MDLNPSIGRQEDGRPRIGDDRLAAARAKVRQGAFGGIVDSKPLGRFGSILLGERKQRQNLPSCLSIGGFKERGRSTRKNITVSANPRTWGRCSSSCGSFAWYHSSMELTNWWNSQLGPCGSFISDHKSQLLGHSQAYSWLLYIHSRRLNRQILPSITVSFLHFRSFR